MGLDEVPDRMNWGEAYRLLLTLAHDPSSRTAASLAGLAYPVSREWMALADLIDMTAQVAGDKRFRYQRPMPEEKSSTSSYGDAAGRTPEEVKALLRDVAAGRAGYALETDDDDEGGEA